MYLCVRLPENVELAEKIENLGIEITYHARWKEYYIKLKNAMEYIHNKDAIDALIKESMNFYNISE